MSDQQIENNEQDQRPKPPLYHGVRGIAVRILNRVERTDSYLDKLLDVELKSSEINDLDKGLLTELVNGVLRWQNKLDWVLNGFSHGSFAKSEINIKNALRVALYQILFLDRVPHAAAVNEAVEFVKRIRGDKPAGLVNAVLRNIIRNMEGIRYPERAEDEVQYLSVVFSHPFWMVKRWLRRFGFDETQKLLAMNNERPELSLRINKLKMSPGQFLTTLEQQQIQFKGSTHVDYFVKVKTLSKIAQMDLFRNGMFTIQDESAAFPCLLLAPKPGDRVIDMCAAPGGKTTHIAEMMKNEGEIIAVDKYEAKLNLIKTACERLGLRNVRLSAVDATEVEIEPGDRVLLDTPCSGLGALAKKPDIKWKRDVSDILKLGKLQTSLLNNAARLVKPGGVLVYSTCTTEPEENQDVIKAFLKEHPEFSIDHAGQYVSHAVVTPEGFVETFPHKHCMDGSFAVRLMKKE
ncbi:MAG: 16S rRNA (cytosine(967)-C(5))-methyltransferase RsmB [Bacteroidota bacterium]